MENNGQPAWWQRWKRARQQHFSSAEKLWMALRAQGVDVTRGTVLNWERDPKKRNHRPSERYRPVLAAMNPDFAALIAELPTRTEGAADTSIVAELAAEFRSELGALRDAQAEQSRRLSALEAAVLPEAPGEGP